MIKKVLSIFLVCATHNHVVAQDSLQTHTLILKPTKKSDATYPYQRLILPSALITTGAISFAIPAMKKIDLDTKKEVARQRFAKTTVDNYTQFFPAALVFGLNAAGVKGKHNFKDRTLIFASSQLISTALVTPTKRFINHERPDGSNKKSFPSGHTATAFSTAHFMFREYRETNLLLSLTGYPFAIFTGVYRVINDKHWATDVVAGAGIGILSTELAYLLHPKITSLMSGKKGNRQAILMPYYQNQCYGLSYNLQF